MWIHDRSYESWDADRRKLYPDADHHHWETFSGKRPVAVWDPHTGRSSIALPKG